MDNVLINNIDWTYPKAEGMPQTGTYFIGDPSDPTCVSWCLASHYLIYTPLGNPSRFCDSPFGTSFLATTASKVTSSNEISPLVKAVRDGLGVAESSVYLRYLHLVSGTMLAMTLIRRHHYQPHPQALSSFHLRRLKGNVFSAQV